MPITTQQQLLTPPAHRDHSGLHRRANGVVPRPLPELAPHDFVLQLATHRIGDPAFRARWQELLAASESPEKISQSPEFFTCLQRSSGPGERMEVLSLLRLSDASVVGVVPVRIETRALPIKLGPLSLGSFSIEVVTVLGSAPAAQASTAMMEYLATQLLQLFPASQAVFLPALPKDSVCHSRIREFAGRGQLGHAVMGPWHEGHALLLPQTFEQYLERLPRKQRYAIDSNIGVLHELVGALQLQRIESVMQVPQLIEALSRLAPRSAPGTLPGELSLACIAHQGMLQSYVLNANGTAVAAIVGTRFGETLHVHKVLVDKAHDHLAIGTSAIHLAIRDAIAMGRFAVVDFGKGLPGEDFRSLQVTQARAPVMLFDRMKSTSALLISYTAFLRISEAAMGMGKSMYKKVQAVCRVALA